MGQLVDLGIANRSTSTTRLFEQVVPNFLARTYRQPNDYVNSIWQDYEAAREHTNLNGGIFEFILATLFYREALTPLYLQASVAFVPNAIYDLLLYTSEEFPIGISAKTSLRERYKQAALEAVVLKNVHRRARNYLVTLDIAEAQRVKRGIENGDVSGLDKVVVASETELNDLIRELKNYTYVRSGEVDVISSSRIVEL